MIYLVAKGGIAQAKGVTLREAYQDCMAARKHLKVTESAQVLSFNKKIPTA